MDVFGARYSSDGVYWGCARVPDADLEATRQRATECPRLDMQGYLLMGEDDPYGQAKPMQLAHILQERGTIT